MPSGPRGRATAARGGIRRRVGAAAAHAQTQLTRLAVRALAPPAPRSLTQPAAARPPRSRPPRPSDHPPRACTRPHQAGLLAQVGLTESPALRDLQGLARKAVDFLGAPAAEAAAGGRAQQLYVRARRMAGLRPANVHEPFARVQALTSPAPYKRTRARTRTRPFFFSFPRRLLSTPDTSTRW